MSGKLDQSLDQIMKDTGKPASSRGRRPRVPRTAKSKAKAAIRAPTGGVQKNRTETRAPTAASALTSKATGDSKIIVSNLPEDVTETQIKVR
jgi:THO complex subunit 4